MTEQKYTMDSYGRIVAADMGVTKYIKVEDLFKCETCKHGDNGLCNSFMWCEFHEEYRPDMRKLKVTEGVQEVKHGYWIIRNEGNPFLIYGECSVCEFEQSLSACLNFCPNCGAKMYD